MSMVVVSMVTEQSMILAPPLYTLAPPTRQTETDLINNINNNNNIIKKQHQIS